MESARDYLNFQDFKYYNWKDIASKLGRYDRWLRDLRINNQYVDPRPE